MLQIDPLSNRIGARVVGLDLSKPLSCDDARAVDAAWLETHALVFPDQTALSTENQVEFLARFGPVLEERIPGDQHSFVSNADGKGTDEMNDGYREGELTPHMDYTYTPYPADVISLYAVTIPESGTQTRFYNNVTPLERMPAKLRDELARYSIFCAHDLAAMKPDARLYLEGRTDPKAPTQSHTWPLIRQHPTKPGVETLMCTLQQTERIIELSDDAKGDVESCAVLDRIFNEFLYVEENEYVHDWRPGDLVVWDNIALQHARSPCPSVLGPRTFRRVAVCEAGNGVLDTVNFLNIPDSAVAFS
jgi:taurine dioxygenase